MPNVKVGRYLNKLKSSSITYLLIISHFRKKIKLS